MQGDQLPMTILLLPNLLLRQTGVAHPGNQQLEALSVMSHPGNQQLEALSVMSRPGNQQ